LKKTKVRGEESPRNLRESVEEPPNRLESTLEAQEMKWRRSEGVRVQRGMNPLYIPCSPSAGHVRLENQICPVVRLDISGEF
jgi:hypothetical protein